MRKETIYRIALIAFILIVTTFLSNVFLKNREYRQLKEIHLQGIENQQIQLKIPVEFLQKVPSGKFLTFPLSDREKKNYVLHWNPKSNESYITIQRGEFGGWIIMGAAYSIPNAQVRKQLQEFLQRLSPHAVGARVGASPSP